MWLLAVAFAYSCLLFVFIFAWQKLNRQMPVKAQIPSTFCSVLIAVRNEENNLNTLINSLLKQVFPKHLHEIIFIDDHSADQSKQLIQTYSKKHAHIKYLALETALSGKKAAIKKGIKQAQGELIITTDADCEMGANWLSTIVLHYETKKPAMLIAPVVIQNYSFFERLQAIEFATLIASTAAAAAQNRAIMCNGANLAYQKQVFNQFSDALNSDFTSGDDLLLMLRIKKEKLPISFVNSPDAVVKTKAQNSLRSFWNQRKRWVSKTKAYRDFDIILTGIIVLSTNLSLLYLIVNQLFTVYFVLFFLFKTSLDLGLMLMASKLVLSRNLRKTWFWTFPVLQIIYPFYMLAVVLSGWGKFRWKGRDFTQ